MLNIYWLSETQLEHIKPHANIEVLASDRLRALTTSDPDESGVSISAPIVIGFLSFASRCRAKRNREELNLPARVACWKVDMPEPVRPRRHNRRVSHPGQGPPPLTKSSLHQKGSVHQSGSVAAETP